MSITPIQALKFLGQHPRTIATRSEMPMMCPDCDSVGAKIHFQPTNYVHGPLRWSSQILHAAEAHGHPLPSYLLHALGQVYNQAIRAMKEPPKARLCPFCHSPLDMGMQSKKELMCYKCGRIHSYYESDSFMQAMADKKGHPGKGHGLSQESSQSPQEVPLQEARHFVGRQSRSKMEGYLATLEYIQSLPDARRSIASPVPCSTCAREGKRTGVHVGSYSFYSVSWNASLLHSILFHGAPLPPDVKHVIKTFIRSQRILENAAKGPPQNPGITMDRGAAIPSRYNGLHDPYTHFDPRAPADSWG
jgi:hypothetical protein